MTNNLADNFTDILRLIGKIDLTVIFRQKKV